MARSIDRLPEPPASHKVKIVVASLSRTATLGLHQALNILGYRAYHLAELAMFGTNNNWEALVQGMRLHHDRISSAHLQPRYGKREFDKLFAGYDAVVEIPAMFGTDCLEAYLQDADVRFILTERTPKSWARSVNGFGGEIVKTVQSPPLSILKYFNRTLNLFCAVNSVWYCLWADHTKPGDARNEEALMKNYERYVRDVKALIPAERILVVKIEDGLGWEQICPFLEKEVPKGIAYPRGVEHREIRDKVLKPMVVDAAMKLGLTVTVPIAIAVGMWWKWSSWEWPWAS